MGRYCGFFEPVLCPIHIHLVKGSLEKLAEMRGLEKHFSRLLPSSKTYRVSNTCHLVIVLLSEVSHGFIANNEMDNNDVDDNVRKDPDEEVGLVLPGEHSIKMASSVFRSDILQPLLLPMMLMMMMMTIQKAFLEPFNAADDEYNFVDDGFP